MCLKYFVIAVPILMVTFFNPLIYFLSIYTYCKGEMLPVTAGSIPNIVRCYKAAVTKQINQICQQKRTSLVWQRNFYEEIIPDEKALNNIRNYSLNNPLNWCDDQEYLSLTDISLELPF